MIMWILAIVLVALTAASGYRQGATRAGISFIGLIVAAVLALPLSAYFRFPFKFIAVHPLVPEFVAPLIAFIVVSLVFTVIASFVFRKVEFHYRYHVPDAHRAFWERMHKRVGACIGVLNGTVYFVVISLLIAAAGYLTLQTGGAESGSRVLTAVSRAAEDMQSTRMDKVVAPFNPAPQKYFEASDILGILYHNRNLADRVQHYPVFAAMAEQPIFKELGADAAAQNLLRKPSTLEEMLENPKIAEVMTNRTVYDQLMEVDLKDLRAYLETGVSPQFSSERILGRWGFDVDSTLTLNKLAQPDVPASAWTRLRSELSERFPRAVFTAFYDKKAKLQLSQEMEGRASPLIPGARLPSGQTNMMARWATTNATYSATGKWNNQGSGYLVTLGNQNGSATSEARLENNHLSFQFEGKMLSFEKLPD